MNLKLVGKTTIGRRTFTMSDSDGAVQKARYGLSDNFYGGMLKEFRKVKNSGILMCLDKRDNIINLAYIDSELTHEDKILLGLATPEIIVPEVEEVEEEVKPLDIPEVEKPQVSEIDEIIASKTINRRR
jgi:hypothetical protein